MAEAAGMLTGLPGVCVSTLGPGSTNLVNAVANAWLDRVPMLAISGQIESRREPYFTHQVIDQERLFAPVCKWATTIQPHTAATILRKAVRTAMAERPGPVHMTLAADVVGAQAIDDRIALPPLAAQELPFAFGAEAAVSGVVAKIRAARRPVILAGIAAVRGNASASLAKLAESLGCPVVVAPMAKGVLAEDHPLYAGTLDMACNAFMWQFLAGCDLIVAAGFDAVELIKPWSLDVADDPRRLDAQHRPDLSRGGRARRPRRRRSSRRWRRPAPGKRAGRTPKSPRTATRWWRSTTRGGSPAASTRPT